MRISSKAIAGALLSALLLIAADTSTAGAGPSVEAVTDRILVSQPGHKMSEFRMSANPLDPRHLVLIAHDWSSTDGGRRCAAYVSRDGGRSWSGGPIEPLRAGTSNWDVWMAFGPDGRPHAMCMWRTGDESRLAHAVSDDGGFSWTVGLLPAYAGQDKGSFAIDASGHIHACFATPERARIITSRDGGASWSEGALEGPTVLCNGLEPVPDGSVVANVLLRGDEAGTWKIASARSIDDGATWTLTTAGTIRNYSTSTSLDSFARPTWNMPMLAVDPTDGDIAIVAQTLRDDGSWRPLLVVSTDGGASYTEVSIPQLPTDCSSCHTTNPAISFDPEGTLGLQLLVRHTTGFPEQEIWFLASDDLGDTWSAPLEVATAQFSDGQMSPLWLGPDGRALTGDVNRIASGDVQNGANQVQADSYGFLLAHHDGGYTWGPAATSEGFLATWIDASRDGPPAIWTRLIRVTTD